MAEDVLDLEVTGVDEVEVDEVEVDDESEAGVDEVKPERTFTRAQLASATKEAIAAAIAKEKEAWSKEAKTQAAEAQRQAALSEEERVAEKVRELEEINNKLVREKAEREVSDTVRDKIASQGLPASFVKFVMATVDIDSEDLDASIDANITELKADFDDALKVEGKTKLRETSRRTKAPDKPKATNPITEQFRRMNT